MVRKNINIISLGLFLLLIAAKTKDPIVIPIGDNSYINLKDISEMRVMFITNLSAFAIWAAKAVYDVYVKKADKSEEKIEELLVHLELTNKKLERIDAKMEHFISRGEAQDIAQKTVEFYDGIRREQAGSGKR